LTLLLLLLLLFAALFTGSSVLPSRELFDKSPSTFLAHADTCLCSFSPALLQRGGGDDSS
jgi:hypothetical protein